MEKSDFPSLVDLWQQLGDEYFKVLIDSENTDKIRDFIRWLIYLEAKKFEFIPIETDSEALHLLVECKRPLGWILPNLGYKTDGARALHVMQEWRKLATEHNYIGPILWQIPVGSTLKYTTPKLGPCWDDLKYLQNWLLQGDECTKKSLVFWIPRLVKNSTNKTIKQMEEHQANLRREYNLPRHHCRKFGSAALIAGLILAHLKRTRERVPLNCYYAASDTSHVEGGDIYVGAHTREGLLCSRWWNDPNYGGMGYFPLGVEELEE